MRFRSTIAAIAIVAVGLAGCGTQAASPAGATADPGSIAPGDADGLRYTCGRFPFGSVILERPGTAEQAADPMAAALRAHLARPDMDVDWLPDTGWTLVGADAVGAEFVAVGGDSGMLSVSLVREGGSWSVGGWGGCQPMRVLPVGLGEATWDLAAGQEIGPETTTFEALVTERDCASGQPSEGRIVGPDVLAIQGQVLVTFAVRPLGGDVQMCPGNPPTRVTVTLPEPLGDRRLLDGSTLPPREPATDP